MLELFSFHGYFDLKLEVKGDTHIDIHHTNEDIGIVLGKIFKKALGEKEGIRRFGSAFAPMEATLDIRWWTSADEDTETFTSWFSCRKNSK